MSTNNIVDTKSLHVVFERKKVPLDFDYDYEYVKRTKVKPQCKNEKNDAKRELQKKLNAMRGDYQRKHQKNNVTITNLIEAIKDSNAQENAATDRFIDNVECMMFRFDNDLDKLQKIYSNVMKKLPKI